MCTEKGLDYIFDMLNMILFCIYTRKRFLYNDSKTHTNKLGFTHHNDELR